MGRRRRHRDDCTCGICQERRNWEAQQAQWQREAEERIAKATKLTHPRLPGCEILVFGDGTETWKMDYGLVDDSGRRIGGVVWLARVGNTISVQIHATRDGVTFGALRRRDNCASLERAHKLAEAKLQRQREAYQRKFPGKAPDDNQQRS